MAVPSVRIASGVAAIAPADWDRWAGDNVLLSHAFLSALEESGSATAQTGWQPTPLILEGVDGEPAGAMPAYLKSHSQGEYVFDHGWAQAWERAGGRYYPKLQIAVPFTPVTGPRLLAPTADARRLLIKGAEALVVQHKLSSAHATFLTDADRLLFEESGWLIRYDHQFHWTNRGYGSFDDFLADLSSRKRKAIRKEREQALSGLEVRHLTGTDIDEAAWDAFWVFYQDTGARKWGRPYLTRSFFSLLGERLADRVLLIMAYRNGRPVAGALNLIGSDALFGRYWGATETIPFLHFEICYYQAIDFAIARKLDRVEAGAQGEHKLARGYAPVRTASAHFVPHQGFRDALEEFLAAEERAVAQEGEILAGYVPFRQRDSDS